MKWKFLAFAAVLFGVEVSCVFAQSATFTLDHNLFHVATDMSVTTTFISAYGGNAKLAIYNSSGEMVKNLYNSTILANAPQTLTWDGKNTGGTAVASGVYFFWLQLDLGVQIKKLIVVR